MAQGGKVIAWLLARPRLALYGVAGAAILGGVAWAVHDVRSAYAARAALPIARQERDAAIATIKRAGEEAERNARIANDYHDQIDRLRADLRAKPIVVRVCADPAKAVLPAGPAPRTDAPAPGPETGEAAANPEPIDVTGPLNDYALDCAAAGLQLVALQRWVMERP